MRNIIAFLKNHWLFLSLYSIIFLAIIICVYYNLKNEVENSKRQIRSNASQIFGNNQGVCVQEYKDQHAVVSFKLAEKPDPEGKDSSIYKQMYGGFNTYYVATNKPWNIKHYLYEDGEFGELRIYVINPCAVGVNDYPPEKMFDKLYEYINESYKVRDFLPQVPEDIKSTYHYFRFDKELDIDTDTLPQWLRHAPSYGIDTLWFNHYKGKLFFTERLSSIYIITEDYNKTCFDLYTRIAGFILLETLLFALFWYLRKKGIFIFKPHINNKKHQNMKKITSFIIGTFCLFTAGCGTLGTGAEGGNVLGNVLGTIVNGGSITNVITSVIGLDKVNAQQLVGSWRYTGPGVAFTTENLLAKAGGEVAARQIEEKLREQYDKVGISSANTFITFTNDNTFEGKVDGKPLSGTYTLDEKTGALKLKTLLLTLNGYVKRSGLNGISIVFESKKLLSVLQTLAAMSGNSSIEAIGTISKNYDGIRVGFNMGR